MQRLRDDGLVKVREGLTSIAEIERMTSSRCRALPGSRSAGLIQRVPHSSSEIRSGPEGNASPMNE